MKTSSKRSNGTFARLATLALAALAPLMVAGNASAAYPPGPIDIGPIVYPDSPTVTAGTTFGVTVIGCVKGQQVTIVFNSVERVVTCGNPRATTTFTAPCTPGNYPIVAVVGGVRTTSSVTVKGSCDGIPATGASNLQNYVALSVSALASGAILFVVSRLRRRTTSTA